MQLLTDWLMFPDRVDHVRLGPPSRDEAGGLIQEHLVIGLGLPCKIDRARETQDGRLGATGNSTIDTVIFPKDAYLRHGDILFELTESGTRTGRAMVVQRYDRIGILWIRRWQADCISRNAT